MTRRMLTALVALIGVLLAAYLTLYKVGLIGTLACGTGACETVQLSRWATFLGLPVAAWGIGFYVVVLALSLAGLQDRWSDEPWVTTALLIVTGWGLLFSAWLTYLELAVIRAICRYCVVSAVLVVILFMLALLDWRARRASPSADGRRSPR